MMLFAKFADPSPLARLKMSLQLRHLFPSAPDTLRAFPFRDADPFIIESKGPDVFFAGCQPMY